MKSNSTREKDSLSTTEIYGFIGFILTYIALYQTVDIDEWGFIAKAIFSGVILMFVIFGWSVGFSFLGIIPFLGLIWIWLGIIDLYWFPLMVWMIANLHTTIEGLQHNRQQIVVCFYCAIYNI